MSPGPTLWHSPGIARKVPYRAAGRQSGIGEW